MMANKRTGKKERRKEEFGTNQFNNGSKNEPRSNWKVKKIRTTRSKRICKFYKFSSLTLKNVKQACEDHYNQQIGSCDVLHSDRGSSCVEDSQIAGKKVFLVRF